MWLPTKVLDLGFLSSSRRSSNKNRTPTSSRASTVGSWTSYHGPSSNLRNSTSHLRPSRGGLTCKGFLIRPPGNFSIPSKHLWQSSKYAISFVSKDIVHILYLRPTTGELFLVRYSILLFPLLNLSSQQRPWPNIVPNPFLLSYKRLFRRGSRRSTRSGSP
jgi:hypothetical protein